MKKEDQTTKTDEKTPSESACGDASCSVDSASEGCDPYKVRIGGITADPYRIARAYGINDPVFFQALKKLLRSGRKHKDLSTDIREVITSLERWEEMNAEDNAQSYIAHQSNIPS